MYDTSREFLADLKSYKEWQNRKQGQLDLLKDLKYLRYEKVKSPLDYDVVGYQGKEQIRAIKTHGAPPTIDERWDTIERIDGEIERVTKLLKRCEDKLTKIEKALDMLPVEVKGYCIEIYIDGKSYHEVAEEHFMAISTLYRAIKNSLKIFDDFH